MQFNIADLFESLVDEIPDREALVVGERRLTYRQLDERANRLAHALAARGIGPGDHVGMYLYNSAEFVEAMLACFKLRAVPININYRYVEEELRYLCANADLKAIFVQRELSARWNGVAGRLPDVKLVIVLDEGSGVEAPVGSFDYEGFLAGGGAGRDFGPRSGDDLYVIYTGGTTGMPRGVMWRHEDLLFAGLQGGNPGGDPITRPEEMAENAREDWRALTIVPAAPLIHGAAQFAVWISMFSGGKAVFAPGRSFDAELLWDTIAREEASTLLLVGDAMARPLADVLAAAAASGRPRALPALRVIASSGAILSASVKAELERHLPETMVLNQFGASETGHQGAAFESGEGGGPGGEKTGAPKVSWVMTEGTAVLDEDLRPIEPGSGRIGRLARSGRVPLGYYKDPEKTAATFVTLDGVRWVLPGDLATIEADGSITVFGRGAVCINSGGEKVFPEEVEEALKAHPDVLDAVVVGVPDARWGERVAALVQLRPGRSATAENVAAHCRTRVAGYKVPREVHFVESVQRHPSGKPDYRWARSQAVERSARAAAGA